MRICTLLRPYIHIFASITRTQLQFIYDHDITSVYLGDQSSPYREFKGYQPRVVSLIPNVMDTKLLRFKSNLKGNNQFEQLRMNDN